MSSARIAVTGVGIVSALGQSARQTFQKLNAGERGIRPISLFDPGDVRSRLVGEVQDLRVADAAGAERAADFSRTDAMAVLAAREAKSQARLPERARLGVVLGGTTGGMFETEGLLSSPELAALPPGRAAELISYPLSASLARVSQAVGGALLTRSICSACSGGAIALVQGAAWLSRGDVDYVLAGGADGLCRLTVLGFNALGATDPEPCRPFDRARGGLNLGEGAAVLVLERESSALARGADVLAWLDGFALGAEAHHITHPDPSGACAVRLMKAALARAGRTPSSIGYVNAHGTGTQQNDAMEASALLEVLGPSASQVWVSSSKAQLGHSLGASGALEAAITVLALRHGQVPPTAGLVDPEVTGLRHVQRPGTSQQLEAALSSSFGFGGMSCVLAFAARDTPAPPLSVVTEHIAVKAASSAELGTPPESLLVPERSRRFDRGSAYAAVGATLAPPEPAAPTGLVLGTAFGNVERTMAFLARAAERGPRLAPPAEFPHLVPSAPAGNASVYGGLTGPVFAVSDLALSGEAACAAGADLLELGLGARVVVGAIAPRDRIVERVLGPLLRPAGYEAAERAEGAAFLLLEALEPGKITPQTVLVLARCQGALDHAGELGHLPCREEGLLAQLVLGVATRELCAALDRSSWHDVPRVDVAAAGGYHEALGAVALVTAARLLFDQPELARVLVVAGGAERYSALLLGRGSAAEG